MRGRLQDDPAPELPQQRPLVAAAVNATAALHWLRRGLNNAAAGLFAPVLGPAPARLRTRPLDLHRMNRAQARAAVLEAVHRAVEALPGADVAEARAALLAGASPHTNVVL